MNRIRITGDYLEEGAARLKDATERRLNQLSKAEIFKEQEEHDLLFSPDEDAGRELAQEQWDRTALSYGRYW